MQCILNLKTNWLKADLQNYFITKNKQMYKELKRQTLINMYIELQEKQQLFHMLILQNCYC